MLLFGFSDGSSKLIPKLYAYSFLEEALGPVTF